MSKESNVIEFYVLCNRLKNVVRTGWIKWGVNKERVESIAEHIYGTQMLAIAMYSEYNYDLDLKKVLFMLACHELEEILITADIGVNTVMDFVDRLKKRVYSEKIDDPNVLKEIIVDELFIIYVNDSVLVNKINYNEDGPTVILFVGVNGVGKTTTIAKIAWRLKNEGKKVLLVGADTFRAGAVEQLREWSEKVGVSFYGREEGSDPASVVYDGVVDTAGRLQNKVNLMKELEKMNKVISGLIPNGPHETLLVIDATTGQNGISQANAFKEITNITGIVLTKLDGTAKGGIVLAIKESVGIPVKFIGLGEAKEDLQVLDIEKYIYGLFKDLM